MTAEKLFDSQIKKYTDILGMPDMVKGKKTTIGRSKGAVG